MWLAAHTTKSHSNDILWSSTFFTSWAPAPSAVWGWTGSVPWVYESLFLLKTAAFCCWKWVRWEGGTEPHKKCAVKSKLWAKRGFGYCCDTINENPVSPLKCCISCYSSILCKITVATYCKVLLQLLLLFYVPYYRHIFKYMYSTLSLLYFYYNTYY